LLIGCEDAALSTVGGLVMVSDDRDMDRLGSAGAADECELRFDGHAAWQPFPASCVDHLEPRSFTGARDVPLQRSYGMSDKDRPRKAVKKRPTPLDASFDRYLSRQLHEIYDPILDEAIPDSIASVLERFAEKPAVPPPAGEEDRGRD
jgi:hypothetical protein